LLDNSANLVNNYKIKYEIFIFSTIWRSKTIITVFEVIVSTLLVDIIVFILLSKKRDRLSKITEKTFISKNKKRSSKIETTTSNKKNNDIEIFSWYCCQRLRLITIN